MEKLLDSERPGKFSSSLFAGLAMLGCFTSERPVRGIADMADELDLGRSTTHRYATTLATLGYLEQGPSRKYRLASRVSDFGLALLNSMAVRRVAREHLRELRAQAGYTVALGLLDAHEVVYIDRRQGARRGQYAIDLGLGVGARVPAYCCAAGKALLASLPEGERHELVVKSRLGRQGPKAPTTKAALRATLDGTASDDSGLALENEELLAGRRAVAAAVLDGRGAPVAAVELAVPIALADEVELRRELGPKVLQTAERIAKELQALG